MFSIVELHTYSSTVRRKFLEKLSTMPWEEVTKNREASFYSMKDIMLHMIDNEDMIYNQVHGIHDSKRREWSEYTDIEMIRKHLDEVEGRTNEYLARADEKELARKVNLVVRSGTFELPVEECFMQSFTEQLYHMGELIALMWQQNVEPPRMGWFFNNPRMKAQ